LSESALGVKTVLIGNQFSAYGCICISNLWILLSSELVHDSLKEMKCEDTQQPVMSSEDPQICGTVSIQFTILPRVG
jgi:hypothetical protein